MNNLTSISLAQFLSSTFSPLDPVLRRLSLLNILQNMQEIPSECSVQDVVQIIYAN